MTYLIDKKVFKLMFMIVDLFIIFLSFYLAFQVRYIEIPARNWEAFISILPWILFFSFILLSIYEIYTIQRKNFWDILRNILIVATFLFLITIAASFMFREFALPRSILIISFVFMILILALWKVILIQVINKLAFNKILLIANQDEIDNISSKIQRMNGDKTEIISLTPVEGMLQMNAEGIDPNIRHIFLSMNIPQEQKAQIIYHAMKMNKTIYVIPSLYDLLLSRATITSVDESMVMAVKPFGFTFDERIIKRILDIVVSLILLIIVAPFLIVIGILIKIESPRSPIIYKQKRLGKDHVEFTLYKFRTMIDNAELGTGPVLSTKNDPRVTAMGRLLRATRLDEFPQLINVLIGDMSMVGPRPEREYFIDILSKQHQDYQYRSSVKPGITGYAQLMGSYDTEIEDKLRFDLYYIRSYSIWLDIVILLRTIAVMIDNKKAEGKASNMQSNLNKKWEANKGANQSVEL